MIQLILILLGLISPNKATNATVSNTTIVTTQNTYTNSSEVVEDTSGETGQILPPKK